MRGKDPIASRSQLVAGGGFSSGESSLERLPEGRVDAGKRGSQSTFVHFRQLFQKGGMGILFPGITGKSEHPALVSGEAGRKEHFSLVRCLCGDMKEGMIFWSQKTSTFVNR